MANDAKKFKKGAPIKLIGGAHIGREGWIDDSRETTDFYTPIIVLKKNGEEKVTKVKHENYLLSTAVGSPTSYEEAVFDEFPDVDQLLTSLCRKMAECEGLDASGDSSQSTFLIG